LGEEEGNVREKAAKPVRRPVAGRFRADYGALAHGL